MSLTSGGAAFLRGLDSANFSYNDRDRELFRNQLQNFVPPDAFDAHAHLYDLLQLAP